jgi:hypothetical protein
VANGTRNFETRFIGMCDRIMSALSAGQDGCPEVRVHPS